MSMIGHLRQITPQQLLGFQSNPSSVKKFLHGEMEANSAAMAEALKKVQQIRLSADPSDPKAAEKARQQIVALLQEAGLKMPSDGPDENGLSLEKSWHALHFLLTGKVDEVPGTMGNVIMGGSPIGPDVGYGPARFLTPPQVKEVSDALKLIDANEIERRFDVKKMEAAQIYSFLGEEELELIQYYYGHLVAYYADAAKQGNAMLLYID